MLEFSKIPKSDLNRIYMYPEVQNILWRKRSAVDEQEFEKATNLRTQERELIEKIYNREQKLKRILNI